MNTVPTIKQKTKSFQIRWNEPLGKEGAPYAYRYVFIFFGYAIRVHIWKCTDGLVVKDDLGKTHYHNHPWWFITFIIKGYYFDVTEKGVEKLKRFSIRFRKANHLHYVIPGDKGCVSILFTGRPNQKWGFWVDNRILRPIKYFKKFGSNAPCKN